MMGICAICLILAISKYAVTLGAEEGVETAITEAVEAEKVEGIGDLLLKFHNLVEADEYEKAEQLVDTNLVKPIQDGHGIVTAAIERAKTKGEQLHSTFWLIAFMVQLFLVIVVMFCAHHHQPPAASAEET